MAQQPAKLDWKKRVDFGLSASQFGMALGFCGKISDYVHYLRNVVGTEMEFTGNACTAHGIRTEPKSRALYELITGCKVHDGSFFLSQDGFLGCSPDGRIFYDVSEPLIVGSSTAGRGSATDLLSESNDSLADSQQRTCVSLPFSIKRSRSGNFSDTSSVTVRHQKVRLLEIKSPFSALYDGSKSGYQPFGIPLHYMCQMQGQMAIANCDECDFFVYLNQPDCQCVCWRVRRSVEFWAWAEPKLLQLVHWVRKEPPSWLDRSFAYVPFDFSKIDVRPVVFPFSLTSRRVLEDVKRFPFFHAFASLMSETGCVTLRGGKGNEVLRSDVVRLLFDEVTVRDDASAVVGVKAVCHLETLVSFSWWNSLTDELEDVDSDMSTQVDVVVRIPDNWETPSVSVECTLPPKKVMHCNVEFHCQDFFLSLKNVQPILSHDVTVQSTPRSRRSPSVRPGELSQKILLSLSPSRKAEEDEECFFRGVTLEEMMEVVEHSEECVGVRVLSTPVGAPLAFNKFTTVVDEDSYTLIFAPQSVFRLLITGEKGDAVKDVEDLFPEGQESPKEEKDDPCQLPVGSRVPQVVYCVLSERIEELRLLCKQHCVWRVLYLTDTSYDVLCDAVKNCFAKPQSS